MVHLLKLVGAALASILRSPARREAEILFLRQQVLVLRLSLPKTLRAAESLMIFHSFA